MEFAYISAAFRAKGVIAPGKRGLGFGTGHEPLHRLLQKRAFISRQPMHPPSWTQANSGQAVRNGRKAWKTFRGKI